jgi:hypothetical protein
MARMQRLTGLDASFLYLETSSQPLHVCSILELDTATRPEAYSFELLRDALLLRLKAWDMADEFTVGMEELLAAAGAPNDGRR